MVPRLEEEEEMPAEVMGTTGRWVLSFEPGQRMFLLLLMLLLDICPCDSYDKYEEVEYGRIYQLELPRQAHSVEFKNYSKDVMVLWRRYKPNLTQNTPWKVDENYIHKNNMTPADSGYYVVKDKYQRKQLTVKVNVVATTGTKELKTDERLFFEADLEQSSCNIYFFSDDETEFLIGRHGRTIDNPHCDGFYIVSPCGVTNERMSSSCTGRFEVRDNNDHIAMVMTVEINSLDFNPIFLVVGGFIILVIIICCCVTRFCCGRTSSRNKPTATLVHYQTYDEEPSGPRRNQVGESRTAYSALPSHATTGPLIHCPPTLNVPPGYSEVFPHTQLPGPSAVPLTSDPEPRFEVKGTKFTFTSPLSSDVPYSTVYTSDKLNFP